MRPILLAVSASKRSPVRKNLEQLFFPILAITKGEITAGMRPNLTSVSPNLDVEREMATSHAETIPTPPPRASLELN
jgi:hypothetical protein